MTIYKFSDAQFQQIQSGLDAGIGMALVYDRSMVKSITDASNMMSDVATEDGELKPFSTYPEDREKLLKLAATIESSDENSKEFADAADALADLVKAILEDEQALIDD